MTELCPKCKRNYLMPGETVCSFCAKAPERTDAEQVERIFSSLVRPDEFVVYANTNAEFLNETYGTHYQAWYQSTYPAKCGSNPFVWMVRFDGKERQGWANVIKGDYIYESNSNHARIWGGQDTGAHLDKLRIVVSIEERPYSLRKYIFLGVYKYVPEKSNPYGMRVYKKVKYINGK